MKLYLRHWKYFDWSLLGAVILLCLIGLLAISASAGAVYLHRQISALAIGLAACLLFALMDYRNLKPAAEVLYGLNILLLILVFNIGYASYGAQRWLGWQGFSLQPAELTKLALLISLAKFFEMRYGKLNSIIEIIPSFILVGIPFFLIFKQPDLGSAVVVFFIFSVVALWGGLEFSRLFLLVSPFLSILVLHLIPLYPMVTWLIYLGGIFLFLFIQRFQFLDAAVYFGLNLFSGAFSPFLWNTLSTYQQNRIISFLNPDIDPLARGIRYHMVKSLIAVGSGGFFGKGFLQGPLTNLQYIPQQHTDFIFSIIGEEFGFLGCIIVLGLFIFVLYRLVRIALQATTIFGSLLVIGTAALLFFQIFINIGMNIGVVPVVGLPLPFISYGGTALVVCLVAIGIAESVQMRKKDILF